MNCPKCKTKLQSTIETLGCDVPGTIVEKSNGKVVGRYKIWYWKAYDYEVYKCSCGYMNIGNNFDFKEPAAKQVESLLY